VPNRFKIVGKKTGSGSQDLPVKLKAPQNSEIWFANDNSFDLPKGMLNVRYKLPFVEQGPEQMAAAKILSAVMKEALVEEAYSANMAGNTKVVKNSEIKSMLSTLNALKLN